MSDNALFKQVQLIRGRTLDQLRLTGETQADIQPAGFNNTIRWNLGHILVTAESFAFHRGGLPMELPASLFDLFKGGTKPADWTVAPPTLAELESLLEDQTARIGSRLEGKLSDKLVEPFRGMETIGEVLSFSLYHEGLHTGYIMAMRRTLQ